jgi:putative multiple sugar transport system substrate-binding protein
MKPITAALAFLCMALAAWTAPAMAADKGTVGICLPTRSAPRWISAGESMIKALQARGYDTALQYAEDVSSQRAQVEDMITGGVKVLVIAAIDGTTLSDALQKAADHGVKVIAYDRLLRGSKNVDYYATFDDFQAGVLQAVSILDKLGFYKTKGRGGAVFERDRDARPFNIELFGGSPDDKHACSFHDGALSVLKPYLDKGKLVVRSKQLGMEKVGTLRGDGAVAQARMNDLLSTFYGTERLHAVLSPDDGLSIGIISSLKGVGYGTPEKPMPVVTGQDAELPSIRAMLRGEQTSTVFKDTRALATVTAEMVAALLAGKSPKVNDTRTYDNGTKVVPAYRLKPVNVDLSNWKAVLVDSGYYQESQVQ